MSDVWLVGCTHFGHSNNINLVVDNLESMCYKVQT